MKTNEHLALFVIGVVTLGVTFLLLFALSGNNKIVTEIDRQSQVAPLHAAVIPQQPQRIQETQAAAAPAASAMPGTGAMDREVADTFTMAAAYIGRGKFVEQDHIALLERLEYYRSISSTSPEQKRAAEDFVNDMNRLLAMKDTVSRQVKLSGQIDSAVTDSRIYLSRSKRETPALRELIDRVEALYAFEGLSDSQNKQLRSTLASLKSAYDAEARKASAPKKTSTARKTAAPAVSPNEYLQSKVPTKAEPKPAPVASKPAPAGISLEFLKARAPVQAEPKQEAPAATASAVSAAPTPKPAPKKAEPSAEEVRTKYYQVMTQVSRYVISGRYEAREHAEITSGLNDLSANSSKLNSPDQRRLMQTIDRMKHVEQSKSF